MAPWHTGYVGWGGGEEGPINSGPPLQITNPDLFVDRFLHEFMPFRNSNFFLAIWASFSDDQMVVLYEVDPDTLEITSHGPLGAGVEFAICLLPMTDTVMILETNDGTGNFRVLTRTGSSVAIGALNSGVVPGAGASVSSTFIRLDDTHFAVGVANTSPTPDRLYICSVSGDTVTQDNASDLAASAGSRSQLVGLIDSTHICSFSMLSGGQFTANYYVYTFTLGGGVSAETAVAVPTPPSGVTNRGPCSFIAGAPDFIHYWQHSTGTYFRPASWDGATINFGSEDIIAGTFCDVWGNCGTVDNPSATQMAQGGFFSGFTVACADQSGTTIGTFNFEPFTTPTPASTYTRHNPAVLTPGIAVGSVVGGGPDFNVWFQAFACPPGV
jgi:hypothetical protein